MKRMINACLILVSLSMSVNAEEGIEVVGKAQVNAQPDQFSLTISIKERGIAASKVKQIVDSKSNSVVNMFVKQGVDAALIDSSVLHMFPIYEKPAATISRAELERTIDQHNQVNVDISGNNHQLQRIKLFDVSRTISVKLSSLAQYDRVLEQLVKIGVSNISPIELGFSNPEALYEQALRNAIDNARHKASNIAKQLGANIGKVIKIKETGYHAPVAYKMVAMESASSFRSQATDRAISAQVVATFEIIP